MASDNGGKPPVERNVPFETSSGKPVKRVYAPRTPTASTTSTSSASRASIPYTRGVQPTMYRGRLWTIRQYAGFSDAEESNRRYKYLLSQGQTGLSVAFDLPTQIGYDPDDQMAEGEVGKVGVSICSIDDMETLFRDIPLETVTTSMTINATASILLALYVAVAKKQGADLSKVGGTIQNDILKEYIARGTYIFPPRPSLRLITDCLRLVQREPAVVEHDQRQRLPHARGRLHSGAGGRLHHRGRDRSTRRRHSTRGLKIDDFAPRMAFFFACHGNFLEEIAKFRAARRLWARTVKERFGAKDPRLA